MTDAPAVLTVETAQALLEVVELEGIETYELSGIGVARENVDEFKESYEIKVAVNATEEAIRTRFVMTFEATNGRYKVDLAVRYKIEREGVRVSPAASVEFAEKVGVMAAFPFLRENVYNLATRLGHPVPVLGLVRQGQFQLTPDAPVVE